MSKAPIIIPVEVVELVIDFLDDIRALGVCSTVSSQWLPRSRHHKFASVRLTSKSVPSFLALIRSPLNTIIAYVQHVELEGQTTSPFQLDESSATCDGLLVSPTLALLSQITSFCIGGFDWTAQSPTKRKQILRTFQRFRSLSALELNDVTFHSLKDMVELVSAFPSLERLQLNLHFTMYAQHNYTTVAALKELPGTVKTVKLQGVETIDALLGSLHTLLGSLHTLLGCRMERSVQRADEASLIRTKCD